jgi:hypothetical protein
MEKESADAALSGLAAVGSCFLRYIGNETEKCRKNTKRGIFTFDE